MLKQIVLGLGLALGLKAQQTTSVLAILSLKEGVKRETVMPRMQDEIRATVQLYLDGKIVQWYSRGDGKGVVFILNSKSVEEAKAVLDTLPLIQERLAYFDYVALAPLTPLRLLMEQK